MNWDFIAGNWKEAKGKVREKWGRLTNDEVDEIAGRREQLEGKLQKVYGKTADEARQQVDDFVRNYNG